MITNGKTAKRLLTLSLGFAIAFSGAAWSLPTEANAATSTSFSTTANKIIALGKKYMGTPYDFGAPAGVTSRFDCSSFVQYVYKKYGINLPRRSIDQSKSGTYVSRSNLRPGDLVFFYSPVSHVAIYIGDGKILHTYGKPGVTISGLNSGWWDDHYKTARRVIPSSGSTSSTSSGTNTGTIVASVNFRSSPSTSGKVLDMLHSGEKVTILSKVNSYWYKVRTSNGKIGYVSSLSKYIRT
jgi:hypothetical protein